MSCYSVPMKTLQELREEERKAIDELRASYKAKKDKAKQIEMRAAARDNKAGRKTLDHAKYLLAGALVADMKKSGDVSRLRALQAEQEKDADKKAVERLIAYILAARASTVPVQQTPAAKTATKN